MEEVGRKELPSKLTKDRAKPRFIEICSDFLLDDPVKPDDVLKSFKRLMLNIYSINQRTLTRDLPLLGAFHSA